jgi:hypothetical protein
MLESNFSGEQTMKFAIPMLLMLSLSLSLSPAHAEIISYGLGSLLTNRICPTATNDSQCIAESRQYGGSNASQNLELSSSSMSYANSYSNGTLKLDPANLALPEFKFEITSNAQQRNGVNLFAYQQYHWTGADAQIVFDINFDFIMSLADWGGSANSIYNVAVGLVRSIEQRADFFPYIVEELTFDSFRSAEKNDIIPNVKYFSELNLSYNVKQNESFYLYTQVQAFAMNTGYVNSLNTLTADVNVFDQNGTAISRDELQNSLTPVNRPNAIDAPASLPLFSLALLYVVYRRRMNTLR